MKSSSGHCVLLEFKGLIGHVNCPGKLVALGAIVDLLNGNFMFLAPRNRDAGIQIVKLGRSQSYLFVFFLFKSGRERASSNKKSTKDKCMESSITQYVTFVMCFGTN